MKSSNKIRYAGVAGMFYPGEKMVLERELSLLLEASPVLDLPRPVRGIIAPHAGYMYSGGVAARAYRQIFNRKYDTVVIIAPSHQDSFDFISIFNGKGYRTPLGDVEVDLSAVEELVQFDPVIQLSDKGHSRSEHALEVQLPFLKWALGNFRMVPVSMGSQNWENIHALSNALSQVLKNKRVLFIASSDLSHFYPDSQARIKDQVAESNIENYDEDQLWRDIQDRRCEMCGFGPVISVMRTVRKFGVKEAKVLLYRNSGDITAEKESVVGYLSAVLY